MGTSLHSPNYFPISIKLAGKHVLVVGGGRSGLMVTRRLLDFGARVDVVAPHMMAELGDLALTYGQQLTLVKRKFSLEDEDKINQRAYMLVFACSGEVDQNIYVANLSREAGVLVSSPDGQELLVDSSFVLPAMRKRGHVKIAVSTDGLSFPLARTLLERIEASLGSKIDMYVLFLERLREKLVNAKRSIEQEQAIVRRLGESEEILLAFQRENFEEAENLATAIMLEEEAASVK